MKNILYICIVSIISLSILIFSFVNTSKKKEKDDETIDYAYGNIDNSGNKQKIFEDKKYSFELMLDDDLYIDGYDDFIKISDEKISSDLGSDQCIIDLSTQKSDISICDYIKNECKELECKKYECEDYKKGWYKTKEEGDFAGSGDVMFAKKEGEYTYFLNLECADRSKDNENNPLIDNVINGFKYNG